MNDVYCHTTNWGFLVDCAPMSFINEYSRSQAPIPRCVTSATMGKGNPTSVLALMGRPV